MQDSYSSPAARDEQMAVLFSMIKVPTRAENGGGGLAMAALADEYLRLFPDENAQHKSVRKQAGVLLAHADDHNDAHIAMQYLREAAVSKLEEIRDTVPPSEFNQSMANAFKRLNMPSDQESLAGNGAAEETPVATAPTWQQRQSGSSVAHAAHPHLDHAYDPAHVHRRDAIRARRLKSDHATDAGEGVDRGPFLK